MANRFRLLAPVLLAGAASCTTTPQIELRDSNTTMQVKSAVSVVMAVDYSADGKAIVSKDVKGGIRVWNIADARQVSRGAIEGTTYVGSSVRLSPDGKILAAGVDGGFSDNYTVLLDPATGRQLRKLSHDFAGRLSFSPDGRFLAGNSGPRMFGGTAKILDVQTGAVVREWRFPENSERYALFSPDGRYIALHGNRTQAGRTVSFVDLLDAKSGRPIWSHSQVAFAQVRMATMDMMKVEAMAFSADGKHLAVAVLSGWQRFLRLYDVASGRPQKDFGHEEVRGFKELTMFRLEALAFSPDGRHFVTGSGRADYKLWDVTTATVVRAFGVADKATGDTVTGASAKFSPDGTRVILASLGAARLFDVATGHELATMVGFEDGEWVVVTPQGYYNASEKGDQYLGVAVGGKPYTIGQLRESFYRPDLVRVALSGKGLGELRRIADVKPPPTVAIVETPSTASSDEVVVSLAVTDQGGGIGDVRLYRNGSAVMLEKARNLQVGERGQRLRYRVRLEAGANAIRAVAFNADNSMQSADAGITITASFAPRRPSLYAVVVGIQDFKNPRLKLSYPIADAKLFAETLRTQAGPLYEKVEVQLYTRPQETDRENLIRVLQGMKDKVRPEDLFVFFVASHGTAEAGDYFLITSNVGSISTDRLRADALNQTHLKELLANIPSTKKFIVIDTCNAGALGDALQVAFLTRGMSDATAMKILGRAVGSTVLSASTSAQEAVEGYRGHGLFTYVIAEGLAGKADRNNDGFVSTLELAAYVDDRVPVLAEEVFKHAQYPVVSPSGQGFPLVKVR